MVSQSLRERLPRRHKSTSTHYIEMEERTARITQDMI